MMIMVASMKERGTCVLRPTDVIPIELSPGMQEEFSHIVMCGNISTVFEAPGRVYVRGPDDSLIVWGDMMGLTPSGLVSAEEYAVSTHVPLPTLEFLRICIRHGLYLNKYVNLLE